MEKQALQAAAWMQGGANDSFFGQRFRLGCKAAVGQVKNLAAMLQYVAVKQFS